MHRRFRKQLPRQSAKRLLGTSQKIVLILLLIATAFGLATSTVTTLRILVIATFAFYFAFVGLKILTHFASQQYRPPYHPPVSVDDPDLPFYTVIVPLYKEASVLRRLVKSLDRLNYPKGKLEVLLLLEEDDLETQAELVGMADELPPNFREIVVPHALPKGKPKALNVGLAHANALSSFCVIYDAEDRPDPDQLLTAVAAFRASGTNVGCVQSPLQFWNTSSSWITRFYWAEYVVHFNFVLPGLAKLGLVPPLGGTSNHFRVDVLKRVALPQGELPHLPGVDAIGGWDPWNVTEDAELAAALALRGYRILMIDSVTYEEATAKLRAADKQRRRWLKGYLQTGLVYTRKPFSMARRMGPLKWFVFNLLMLGTPFSLLLNPIYWGLTIAYFTTRSEAIEQLFPGPVFYAGLLLLVAGNVLLFWQLVVAVLHRQGHGSVKYMLLVPVWWAVTSWSAYRILPELARSSTRYQWNKTDHGHDMHREEEMQATMS